jgi:hypothetical protein
MRVRAPKNNPIDYGKLCRQTVTIYRKTQDAVSRTVYKNAFFELKKTQNVDRTGRKEANSFLLVIPGSKQAVYAADKVFEGEVPEISAQEWSAFNPKEVPQLVVVSYADPKYYNGALIHTEAGG